MVTQSRVNGTRGTGGTDLPSAQVLMVPCGHKRADAGASAAEKGCEMGVTLDHPGGPNVISRVLTRGRGRQGEREVTTEAEVRVTRMLAGRTGVTGQ